MGRLRGQRRSPVAPGVFYSNAIREIVMKIVPVIKCSDLQRSLEVEVFALIDELDGGVFLVRELEVKEVTARSNACVEVLVLELQR
jgi:hypothetical protein